MCGAGVLSGRVTWVGILVLSYGDFEQNSNSRVLMVFCFDCFDYFPGLKKDLHFFSCEAVLSSSSCST